MGIRGRGIGEGMWGWLRLRYFSWDGVGKRILLCSYVVSAGGILFGCWIIYFRYASRYSWLGFSVLFERLVIDKSEKERLSAPLLSAGVNTLHLLIKRFLMNQTTNFCM